MSGNNDVTADNVLGIMRRARFVDSIITQFEEKVVSKVTGLCKESVSIARIAAERRQFIRTYYQIWALIMLEESSYRAKIDASSTKQIYLMCEMSRIPLPVGDYLPGPKLLEYWPRS
ncbi:hypothetical protein DM02DRAFT_663418 [Periconia macrospinosa]|uniref:Uncharacterized protein n=1 Tax=Periconia macrospinosa TaxID=97972 RepID=A0A2V1D3B0_9PLEO|nr:hypothetical protein DM02DRAFT_663418 [Periconia macrospinosa]